LIKNPDKHRWCFRTGFIFGEKDLKIITRIAIIESNEINKKGDFNPKNGRLSYRSPENTLVVLLSQQVSAVHPQAIRSPLIPLWNLIIFFETKLTVS
jgi:hypothetical protein